MKITALVENYSHTHLEAKHGLSFYIETAKHKLLFDLGFGDTVFKNAKKINIDISKVDTVIISHGHGDHGRALGEFLKINKIAKVFVQERAFDPHYNKLLWFKIPVGLDKKLKSHSQVILLTGDYCIDEELSLFVVPEINKCYSTANNALFDKGGKDGFLHEHNLIIKEDKTALIMGCGHAGVVNVMDKAKSFHPQICVGGYHLFNPVTKKTAPTELLDDIANELMSYSEMKFYTCHCTGKYAFDYLSNKLPNMFYFSCGEEIIL